MGGSGRGPDWEAGKPPKTLQDLLLGSSTAADNSEHEGRVNSLLADLLGDYNDRDADAIRRHASSIADALQPDVEGTIELAYGGSVRRHTYVDGLSDVDLLALAKRDAFPEETPQKLLALFASRLRDRLKNVEVTVGSMAVTLSYPDGHVVQVLPAIKTATGLRVPSSLGDRWSGVVRPDSFARALTAVNQSSGGRVVPVIKLFKGLVAGLSDSIRPTGYHIESLAVEAFKGYSGDRSYKGMLRHLCGYAQDRVMAPIQDRTGQSLHVDDHMGPAGSSSRAQLSTSLKGLCGRMAGADEKRSLTAWEELMGND